jgi:glucose/arabinose dehydrogenase
MFKRLLSTGDYTNGMKSARWFTLIAVALILVGGVLIGAGVIRSRQEQKAQDATARSAGEDLAVVAEKLQVPWGLAVLPDGDLLVTERPGILTRIGQDKEHYRIDGVTPTSEGGLLGLAIDPKFADNKRIYVYLTTNDEGTVSNQIERYTLEADKLSGREVIFDGIPGSNNHDGGRIAFGPDGYLYATTGDAGNEEAAQDRSSMAGKILRLTADGQAAPGNPFGTPVYSYGHRNPQGLAWDDKGQLWETEHGRSGIASGYDELNLIKPGNNYGWPAIQGDEVQEGMTRPIAHSGPDETWAPSGLAYAGGKLYFGGLRGQSLYEATVTGNTATIKKHFEKDYGRLRTVVADHGFLYITTSNQDGRGEPKDSDDRIIKAKLSALD